MGPDANGSIGAASREAASAVSVDGEHALRLVPRDLRDLHPHRTPGPRAACKLALAKRMTRRCVTRPEPLRCPHGVHRRGDQGAPWCRAHSGCAPRCSCSLGAHHPLLQLEKLRDLARYGLPAPVRAQVWTYLLGVAQPIKCKQFASSASCSCNSTTVDLTPYLVLHHEEEIFLA